jgi:hypothetical protein
MDLLMWMNFKPQVGTVLGKAALELLRKSSTQGWEDLPTYTFGKSWSAFDDEGMEM